MRCGPLAVLITLLTQLVHAGLEAERLPAAAGRIPDVVGRYLDSVARLEAGLGPAHTRAARQRVVTEAARHLWRRAVSDVQSGHPDDRPLYWARLAMQGLVGGLAADAAERAQLLELVELHSRGMHDVVFPGAGIPAVLVTGFDPFHLDRNLEQSNPSGLAALALDGVHVAGAQVQSALVPVRFADFDAGLVEAFFARHYRNPDLLLVLTISMGRDRFDLERFPGRRRSAESADNENTVTGADAACPQVPTLAGKLLIGPEFLEFSLPAEPMTAAPGPWPVVDNRTVTTLTRGTFRAPSLAALSGEIAVRGSGGGYLSNEISYRSLLLRDRLSPALAVGHLHTPAVAGYAPEDEQRMLGQIRAIIGLAVSALSR